MTRHESAKRQGNVSGISEAALKGAKAGDRGEELKEENASTMARPQPGMTDPRSGIPTSHVDPSDAAHSSSDTSSVGGQREDDEE